ncbi:aldose 1-epimerase [Alteromonadaceae bacterium Bs31]|nr:aldose 1-epimerase [Alteromonadaceae bacterium Bs31]
MNLQRERIKPSITSEPFGVLPNGREARLFTLRNCNGMSVKISNFGGVITSIVCPDKDGNFSDVVLGFDTVEPYVKDSPYFGAVIGRYCNRIAAGRFELNGEQWQLACNDGPNHLHGGLRGFDKVLWQANAEVIVGAPTLELGYYSADGDQGYPGNLEVKVSYQLREDDQLVTRFTAVTDRATPVNLSQHSYFNLSGQGDVLDHELRLWSNRYAPVDENLIPTGDLVSVDKSVFDYRQLRKIGDSLPSNNPQIQLANGGYDHAFELIKKHGDKPQRAAKVLHKKSGRYLELFTTEPSLQFYTGNFLDGSLQRRGRYFKKHAGLCLEPQHFPDSPNQPQFPSTILQAGESYRSVLKYKFGIEAG